MIQQQEGDRVTHFISCDHFFSRRRWMWLLFPVGEIEWSQDNRSSSRSVSEVTGRWRDLFLLWMKSENVSWASGHRRSAGEKLSTLLQYFHSKLLDLSPSFYIKGKYWLFYSTDDWDKIEQTNCRWSSWWMIVSSLVFSSLGQSGWTDAIFSLLLLTWDRNFSLLLTSSSRVSVNTEHKHFRSSSPPGDVQQKFWSSLFPPAQ